MPVTLTDAILTLLGDAIDPGIVKTYSGEPGIEGYPFIVVNNLRWIGPRYNSKRARKESREAFQVTIAALDPKEAETLGLLAHKALRPVEDGGSKLVMDDAYEINRLQGDGRTYSQDRAGPNELTIFYWQFDMAVFVDRAGNQ